jgi:hypothetical protein
MTQKHGFIAVSNRTRPLLIFLDIQCRIIPMLFVSRSSNLINLLYFCAMLTLLMSLLLNELNAIADRGTAST